MSGDGGFIGEYYINQYSCRLLYGSTSSSIRHNYAISSSSILETNSVVINLSQFNSSDRGAPVLTLHGDRTMSTLKVDSLVEKTSGNGVHIAGHVVQVVSVASTANYSKQYTTLPVHLYLLVCTASITPLNLITSKILISY